MALNVTSPFLPPREEYQRLVDGIWDRRWMTNNGPLVQELEHKLADYMGLEALSYVSNGTIALQIAIRALNLTGEVITTPFSYVATTSSLVWENCEPVMVDIDPATLNIDASKIERAITPRTTGILATHVFGNACDITAIEAIAKKHGLRVIYDGAHGFGATYNGRSLLAYGDASTLSFHATKLFHTIEGGAVISPHDDVRYAVNQLRNFGHTSPTSFDMAGVNGKNSEFHAAMGLCNLPYIDDILANRRTFSLAYDARLLGRIDRPSITPGCEYNYAYYPVLFPDEAALLKSLASLAAADIHPRRYFYPSLSHLPYLKGVASTPVSDDIAPRVLCLPLFNELGLDNVERVSDILLSSLDKM